VIVDLLHVPGDTVRADYERSRGRFSLVSDCVGDSLGGRPVEASGGEVKGGHGRLAGSKLTMAEAVRNLHALGVPLEEAVAAATCVPASALGLEDVGRIDVGRPADVVVLTDRLEIERVLVGGEVEVAV
jgi:N-acetylglucosamine-6-phosphate deacetylase